MNHDPYIITDAAIALAMAAFFIAVTILPRALAHALNWRAERRARKQHKEEMMLDELEQLNRNQRWIYPNGCDNVKQTSMQTRN